MNAKAKRTNNNVYFLEKSILPKKRPILTAEYIYSIYNILNNTLGSHTYVLDQSQYCFLSSLSSFILVNISFESLIHPLQMS